MSPGAPGSALASGCEASPARDPARGEAILGRPVVPRCSCERPDQVTRPMRIGPRTEEAEHRAVPRQSTLRLEQDEYQPSSPSACAELNPNRAREPSRQRPSVRIPVSRGILHSANPRPEAHSHRSYVGAHHSYAGRAGARHHACSAPDAGLRRQSCDLDQEPSTVRSTLSNPERQLIGPGHRPRAADSGTPRCVARGARPLPGTLARSGHEQTPLGRSARGPWR
jgi:hypothetical protein